MNEREAPKKNFAFARCEWALTVNKCNDEFASGEVVTMFSVLSHDVFGGCQFVKCERTLLYLLEWSGALCRAVQSDLVLVQPEVHHVVHLRSDHWRHVLNFLFLIICNNEM